ncbi:MAG: Lysine-tRNA ligase [Microgenomates group bacterium GW2011_GWA1_48_10]|uniref:Lysine--tRNA ligase n=1 Tax=Candidatus Gottesmanbacteria bacterium RIFCSPHIGHO2_01_FULL_47_48 TaxID=1798381 RepID=A0A1F6A339_9BACT|nr:MAG: Lysine-tRNA ligase [Microgenomates group bacterium GW2011_GWA1_48_10]OGG19066.1 MAG: lysine--tRNA ligase [Candidatus Gottesmanbacteria bacterium RIFCSPHIGHO2_01_FULL_47_48]
MAQSLDQLIKIRREKMIKLQALGMSGFPAWQGSREIISRVKNKNFGDSAQIAGRLTAIRGHGKLIFADLTDESGKIQVSFKADNLVKNWDAIELLDIGDFISVSGRLFSTQAGELTIDTENFSLLTKSVRPLPSSWYGLSDVEERYRQRYVDLLVNPEVKKVFETRTKIIKLLRKKLDESGFVEVETPVLQPLYGGATAKPFITHHNALDIDLYLRISNELFLKRLIVGGFEKVYEIGKDFRNEGIDREHNPEFTMAEFYWAYANYDDLMSFTETLLSDIAREITGSSKISWQGKDYDLTPPWPKVTYRDLIFQDTGIDININDTEEKLLSEIRKKKVSLDLSGVVGYGALLDSFYKEVSRPQIAGPIFLIDHPVALVPLAKRKVEDPRKSATFQLLIGGYEFIKAYNELNDPFDQKARWEEEQKLAKKGLAEHQVLDGDYIRALEYGMPPTAGWGLGIDRFTAFLTDSHGLKDVILFPTMRPEK